MAIGVSHRCSARRYGLIAWLRDFRQPFPAARHVAADNARLAGWVGPDVTEAATQNAGQLEAHVLAEIANLVLRFVDHVAAGFGVLALLEAVADRPDAATDAVARVDHRDVRPEREEIPRGGQAGEPGTGDEDVGTRQRPCHVRRSQPFDL